MKYLIFLVSWFLLDSGFSQNLFEERIWKIGDRKKSIYLAQGVFHFPQVSGKHQISGLRSSYVPNLGYERLVIDFSGGSISKIYGHISSTNKRIAIDFTNANVANNVRSLKNTKYIKNIDIFEIDPESVTMEISLKEKLNFDIFFLENPGRLVIDIKP